MSLFKLNVLNLTTVRMPKDSFWFSKTESDSLDIRIFCIVDGEVKEYTLLGKRTSSKFRDYEFVGCGKFSHVEKKVKR